MPSKHVVRNFEEETVYHVFNIGVEKRDIFTAEGDYEMFLYYLFVYVVPLEKVLRIHPHLPRRLHAKNLSAEVEVLAYCLMPGHFHLMLKQKSVDGTSRLLKQLTNAYTQYFNNKYGRVGGLFQGRFKAVAIETNEQILNLSRYIHLHPSDWSSYPDYIGKRDEGLCAKETISFFLPSFKYKEFVMDKEDYKREIGVIKDLLLDGEV